MKSDIYIPEGQVETKKSKSTWSKEVKQKILSFEEFEIIVSVMQAVDNPKETREALRDLYRQYATATPESRLQWEEDTTRKTKPRFIGVYNFFNKGE